jgi:hypothetical protein
LEIWDEHKDRDDLVCFICDRPANVAGKVKAGASTEPEISDAIRQAASAAVALAVKTKASPTVPKVSFRAISRRHTAGLKFENHCFHSCPEETGAIVPAEVLRA